MRAGLTTVSFFVLMSAAASIAAEPQSSHPQPVFAHMPSAPAASPLSPGQEQSTQQQAELANEFQQLYALRPEPHDIHSCYNAGLQGDPSNTQVPMTADDGSKFEKQMFKVFVQYDIMQLESGLRQECEQQYTQKQLDYLIKLRLYELARQAYPNQPIPIK